MRPREYGKRVKVTLRIEPDVLERLKELSRKKGVSVNLLLCRIVRRYLDEVGG